MFLVAERLALKGNGSLQELAPQLTALSETHVQDHFGALQALQQRSTKWVADARDIPKDTSRRNVADLLQALSSLEKRANPTGLAPIMVKKLRAGTLTAEEVKTVHQKALMDGIRLSNPIQDRGFQDALREELGAAHGSVASDLTFLGNRGEMELRRVHARRTIAMEALLRLHIGGQQRISSRELLLDIIEEYSRTARLTGRAKELPVLTAVAEHARATGDLDVAKFCERAQAQAKALKSITVAHVQLEGGGNKAGGVRSYLNALRDSMSAKGHRQDLYLPLTKSTDKREELVRIPGSDGHIIDSDGTRRNFHLERRGDPLTATAGGREIYWVEDHYFAGREGLYNPPDADRFADDTARLLAGSMLANAAMSKVSAIRKAAAEQGTDGRDLTVAQVQAAEARLTSDDVPQIIQYNDSHLAMSSVYLEGNDAFANAKRAGVVHQGNAAYTPFLERERVESVLQEKGYGDVLPEDGRDPLALAPMGKRMNLFTVSPGFKERTLNEVPPNEGQAQVQAWLREAEGDGRFGAIYNGVDVRKLNPAVYSASSRETFFAKKAAEKSLVQEEFGFKVDPNASLNLMVSRIVQEKGFHNVAAVLAKVIEKNKDAQFIFGGEVGAGANERAIFDSLKALQAMYPDNVRVQEGFLPNARLMLAADNFMAPSNSEPCGIAQLEAEALGCSILSVNIDGLRSGDTVLPWDPVTKKGFAFTAEPEDAASLEDAMNRMLDPAERTLEKRFQRMNNAMEWVKQFDSRRWGDNIYAGWRETRLLGERLSREGLDAPVELWSGSSQKAA
ncbi:MAG: glycosyltransferase [Myxococcaceae bacterium]